MLKFFSCLTVGAFCLVWSLSGRQIEAFIVRSRVQRAIRRYFDRA